MKRKTVVRFLVSAFVCLSFFMLSSVVFLNYHNTSKSVTKEKTDEPYYTGPKSAGLLFTFGANEGFFVFFDFKEEKTYFKLTKDDNKTRISDKVVNYVIECDYDTLSGIIDRTGGVTLELEGQYRRYTGEQVVELLASYPFDSNIRISIAKEVFKNIQNNGFSKDDFVYIIENSGTDLLVPDCFYWSDYIKDTVSTVEVIP
ncbi:MAG: hypothetical protein IJJ40_06390 [Clostridia bacterium]|nr:hypothetical protein [Clostridia bacterium]